MNLVPPPFPVTPTAPYLPAVARAVARTRVIGITTLIVALVASLAALWPFLFGNEVAQVVGGGSRDPLRTFMLFVRLGLAGGFPWLGAYAVRLLVQVASAESVAKARRPLLDNLRKIRRILIACMFLSIASVSVALASRPTSPYDAYGRRAVTSYPSTTFGTPAFQGLSMAVLYAVCSTACCIAAGNVRKALAEFDEPAPDASQGVGFEVQFAMPPIPAAPVGPVPVVPMVAAASPLVRTVHSHLPDAADAGNPDLRFFLNVIAVTGIVLYAIQMPLFVGNIGVAIDVLQGRRGALSLNQLGWTSRSAGGPNTPQLLGLAASLVGGVCGVWWICWSVACLTLRPMAYRAARVFAIVTLTAAGVLACVSLISRMGFSSSYFDMRNYASILVRNEALRTELVGLLYPAFLWCILSRGQVKHLFAKGSEASE